MPYRRSFLQALAGLPVIGGLLPAAKTALPARDYFKELGVTPFINAAGTYTTLTASLMAPEVVDAYNYASKQFVRLNEVHDAAGQKIASLVGAEAAMVTSGAAAALTVGTAACLTGDNMDMVRRLPDITGMKSEVIMLKSHRYGYDHAVRNCGVKIVEVETAAELERAVSERTAMMLFFNANEPDGKINNEEFVALGKKHRIPTFNDAAADVPPIANLSKYAKMGYDLVTFSGGKGIRGPQSAGVLFGRKDLIRAARLNCSPNGDAIGRGLKVNKEEIVSMMVAVERYTKLDHQAEWREWERRVKVLADSVASMKGVTTSTWMPPVANHVPHLKLSWDAAALGVTVPQVVERLRKGTPSIEVVPNSKDDLYIAVWMLQPHEVEIVSRRLKESMKVA